ncbi:hypothetical protein H072_1176 [Dactylellina haptotyla CBS 200.50]|uniref:Uncharacterized protein n=1 Tax=Dactylellina haptotyla (strain CBS 200.50) TaxID=1284197 RepID=S8APM3_DACHA|nr:hypothetical protein H072_1176 [Dactylellina haptotyla CBS 200.50]
MSTTKTLKLLNSITTTTSASHRRRRSSAAVTAAAFAPMFQSTVQPNFYPHCPPQQLYGGAPRNDGSGGVNMMNMHTNTNMNMNMNMSMAAAGQQQYHPFLPVFVTPTTPASSDHQTSYHGTNVTVTSPPPPYYFHTPPISSVGGAGGAAIVGGGRTAGVVTAGGLNHQQAHQQLFYPTPNHGYSHPYPPPHPHPPPPAPQVGGHSGNHSPNYNHALAGLNSNHTRTGPLPQAEPLHKKHGSRPSLSQFSVASSPHFQFAFEAQPPSHDSIASINSPFNSAPVNLNTPAVTPTFSRPAVAVSHSRQSPQNHIQIQQPPQPQLQPTNDTAGFNFLCLNPEPIAINNPQPVVQPQLKAPSCGRLPGGFFSLTPEDSYPPLCTSAQPSTNLCETQLSNSYFPIMPVNPVVQQIAPRNGYATSYQRPTYQRLTKHAVAAVDSRDSREFRWNRVLRYVHEISAPHGAAFPPSDVWIQQQRLRIATSPREDGNGDGRSLWDGGSLGTNGVDDFIWDDDLQNGKRFTIPPKSQQGDVPREEDNLVFSIEPTKQEYDLAFGYEVDDSNFHPPAKRTKSNESQKAARRGLHEYLAALKSFELSHVQDMKRDAPISVVDVVIANKTRVNYSMKELQGVE